MATRTKKTSKKNVEPVVVSTPVTQSDSDTDIRISRSRLISVSLAIALLLGLFWYKTNTWPVAALVDYQPIFRWQLDQVLYSQAGTEALDSLVIEKLITNEIKSKNIVVMDSEVQARIDQIKTQVGSEESFQQALEMQGLTEESLKNQFKLQLGLERLVEPSTDSAVLQERIYNYIEGLRSSGRVKVINFNQ